MTIISLPEKERPREKLLQLGAEFLSDAELLAIFLRTGVKGCSAIELSRKMLAHFGGIRQLLTADKKEFCAFHGMGTAKYVQLTACIELMNRFILQKLQQQDVFTCPDDLKKYLSNKIRDKAHEVFYCLYLNNQHQLIADETLFRGTIDSASVHPREVVKQAIYHNASALIIAHNHPSGNSQPSDADIYITGKIKSALELVDIRLLDHFIIGNSEIISLSETGKLN